MVGGNCLVVGGGDPVVDPGEGAEGREFDRRNPPPHCMWELDSVTIPGARSLPHVFRAVLALAQWHFQPRV